MQQHIGTKVVSSTPMTRAEYNEYRGWELPGNEDGRQQGSALACVTDGRTGRRLGTGGVTAEPKKKGALSPFLYWRKIKESNHHRFQCHWVQASFAPCAVSSIDLAYPEGIEPSTCGFGGRCSAN